MGVFAYANTSSKNADNVNYQGMFIFYLHASQQVVSMVEHCMIDHVLRVYPRRCANIRRELDNYERFAQSSEDEKNDDMAWCCYVAYGPPTFRGI